MHWKDLSWTDGLKSGGKSDKVPCYPLFSALLMVRRLIAIAGIAAFVAICLPGLGAPWIWDLDWCPCCDSAMCPMMHHTANGQVVCGMDMYHMDQMGTGGAGPSVQGCPGPRQHYTMTMTFAPVGPAALAVQRRATGSALLFAAPNRPEVQLDVPFPPPRFALV